MICGIGIDIQDVRTFAESVAESGDAYLGRVFTRDEKAYCDASSNAMEAYAARFAAKEAGMKAIGLGAGGSGQRDGIGMSAVTCAGGPPPCAREPTHCSSC